MVIVHFTVKTISLTQRTYDFKTSFNDFHGQSIHLFDINFSKELKWREIDKIKN